MVCNRSVSCCNEVPMSIPVSFLGVTMLMSSCDRLKPSPDSRKGRSFAIDLHRHKGSFHVTNMRQCSTGCCEEEREFRDCGQCHGRTTSGRAFEYDYRRRLWNLNGFVSQNIWALSKCGGRLPATLSGSIGAVGQLSDLCDHCARSVGIYRRLFHQITANCLQEYDDG
jgi:hypothetical protein